MDRFCQRFGAERLRLTCCFRCPRRVLFLAQQLQPHIRAAPGAPVGSVELRFAPSQPWATTLAAVAALPAAEDVLFLSRSNRPLLDLLEHVHTAAVPPRHPPLRPVRWSSPALSAQLDELLGAAAAENSLGALLTGAERHDPTGGRGPVDPTVLRILRTAVRLEGALGAVAGSPWLDFVRVALRSDTAEPAHSEADSGGALVLATIHAAKGAEYPHVILFEYNTIGYETRAASGGHEHEQEANLLYVALTRASQTLTFIFPRATSEVASPLLPRDVVHQSREIADPPSAS